MNMSLALASALNLKQMQLQNTRQRCYVLRKPQVCNITNAANSYDGITSK